jgi:hypothetical protein
MCSQILICLASVDTYSSGVAREYYGGQAYDGHIAGGGGVGGDNNN